jgi:hypothetical protein
MIYVIIIAPISFIEDVGAFFVCMFLITLCVVNIFLKFKKV